MADLSSLGRILALIAGILGIIGGAFTILEKSLGALEAPFSVGEVGGSLVNGIISIVLGALLVAIYINKIEIKDKLILGIVVIVLSLLLSAVGSLLGIVGGILILVDKFS